MFLYLVFIFSVFSKPPYQDRIERYVVESSCQVGSSAGIWGAWYTWLPGEETRFLKPFSLFFGKMGPFFWVVQKTCSCPPSWSSLDYKQSSWKSIVTFEPFFPVLPVWFLLLIIIKSICPTSLDLLIDTLAWLVSFKRYVCKPWKVCLRHCVWMSSA